MQGNRARAAILALLALIVTVGCGGGDEEPGRDGPSRVHAEIAPTVRLCFRNVYGDREGERDVEELLVRIDGARASGTYNWLPAFKDQRRGSFAGDWSEGVVRANYTFMQEGRSGAARIQIAVDEKQAVVSGGAPELGLGASIAKVRCH